MRKKKNFFISFFAISLFISLCSLCSAGTITGELKVWHKITITFDGPSSSEGDTPNPFMDYRMNVTFTGPSAQVFVVPGYYAADGNAANTSANSGNKWRAHLAPDEKGTWHYSVSFRSGTNIAVSDVPGQGSSAGFMDGETGNFTVGETDKTGRDMRAKGRLDYVGGHFLQFAGNGEYFFKQGTDSPENFLAYAHFDGPFKSDGTEDGKIKTWSAHVGDWNSGDVTWSSLDGNPGTYGKAIIGAINYLASEGLNAFSFLTMNINGDDKNVFPYTTYSERNRMDCSKLDQWELVFEHGDKMGMFLHFKTLETENELLLNSGNLGNQRKLYYRELVARFSHHLALNWNLGEEINNASTAQKVSWAQYFFDIDPYHHHIVIHNGSDHYDMLGNASKLTGFSKQANRTDFSDVFSGVKDYIDRSRNAGKPWAVACDEPGNALDALRPDYDAGNSHEDGRKDGLWGCFMAGGFGNEWYFGYGHDHSDLTCQDFRSRDAFWDYCHYALQFFSASNDSNRKPVPAQNMSNADSRVDGTGNHCLYGNDDEGKPCLVVSTDNGGSFTLNTPAAALYKVGWMNAKTGSWQYGSDIVNHAGGNINFTAPSANDWILLLHDWQTTGPATFDKVELYEDCDYQGWSANFGLGSYNTAALQAAGAFDNAASSIVIPFGFIATLFDNDDFTGDSITLTADDDCFDDNNFDNKTSSMIVDTIQQPFNDSPWPIPGAIEAEEYDLGGQELAYNDTTTGNIGNADYRTDEDVDISQCSEGGYNISWTEIGEWLEYTVDVELPGHYNIDFRVASETDDSTISLEFDGQNTTGPVNFGPTGGWQTYQTVTAQNINLAAGKQVMRLVAGTNPFNLSTITIDSSQKPYTGLPSTIPGTIEMENFDTGGQDISYYDKTPGNIGNSDYRDEDVDISNCDEGGANISWIETGEWLEYTVNVTETAVYDLELQIATDNNIGGSFHLDVDDKSVTGIINFGPTGGWQTYQTSAYLNHIKLTEGKHIIRLTADSELWNVNWMKFTKSSRNRGSILRQWWENIESVYVPDLTSNANYPDKPTGSELITTMQCPIDWADNYGTRLRGYIHPPVAGDYTFWISSDNRSELWLSTDRFTDTITRIAHVLAYTATRQWDKYAEQQSAPIYLEADKKYYVECLHKEGDLEDSLAVAWQIPGQSLEIIDGQYLSPWAGDWTFGDFSDDNTVNAEDLVGFAALWLNENCPELTNIDKDGNCRIDLYEFALFAENWMEQ